MLTTDIVNDAGQESFSSANTVLAFADFGRVVDLRGLVKESRLLFSSSNTFNTRILIMFKQYYIF